MTRLKQIAQSRVDVDTKIFKNSFDDIPEEERDKAYKLFSLVADATAAGGYRFPNCADVGARATKQLKHDTCLHSGKRRNVSVFSPPLAHQRLSSVLGCSNQRLPKSCPQRRDFQGFLRGIYRRPTALSCRELNCIIQEIFSSQNFCCFRKCSSDCLPPNVRSCGTTSFYTQSQC